MRRTRGRSYGVGKTTPPEALVDFLPAGLQGPKAAATFDGLNSGVQWAVVPIDTEQKTFPDVTVSD